MPTPGTLVRRLWSAALACLACAALLTSPRDTVAAPGDLDPTFAGGAGRERVALSPGYDFCRGMVVQADGRVVLAGQARQGEGEQIGLLRLNSDGSLDSTFGTAGKRVEWRVPAHFYVSAMQALADGRLVVAGQVSDGANSWLPMVARFTADGVPDSTFGGDGCVVVSVPGLQSIANALAVQTDGKLVLAGSNWTGNDGHVLLVRLNVDGSLDATFDGDGVVETDLGSVHEDPAAVVLQADGKIVIAGSVTNNLNVAHSVFVRYLSNGALDTSFDSDGKLFLNLAPASDAMAALTLQKGSLGKPDRLVATGWALPNGGIQSSIVLVRLNLNGTFDTGFDGDGVAFTSIAGKSLHASAVAVTTDRSGTTLITVGGAYTGTGVGGAMAARYTSAGALDTSFDGDGLALSTFLPHMMGPVVMRLVNGGLYLAGRADTGIDPDFAVMRLTSAGALDLTFHGDGVRVENIGYSYVSGDVVAIQPDGRLLVSGNGGHARPPFMLARFLGDGSLDGGFGVGGEAEGNPDADTASPHAILLQPDTSIVVAGSYWDGGLAARYLPNGVLDPAFGTGGVAHFGGVLTMTSLNGMARQSDGKLVFCGERLDTETFPSTSTGVLVRLDAAGAADQSFSFFGRALFDSAEVLTAVAVDAQGRIVAAGTKQGQMIVGRFLANGQPDPSFHGEYTRVSISTGSAVAALLIQPDGKIVLAGSSAGPLGDNTTLVRLRDDGTLDPGFGSGGVLVSDQALGADRAVGLARQADGTLLVALKLTNVTLGEMFFYGHGDFAVAAFRPDGTPESNYGQGGRRVIDLGFATNDDPRGLALDAQGRAVVVGASDGAIGLCRLTAGVFAAVDPVTPLAHGLSLSAPAPNPLRGETRLDFALPSAGRVTADVLDVGGRRVRRLLDAELPAGRRALSWNGRDDAGAVVAAGVYFVTVRAPGLCEARRVVVMR